MSKKRPLSPPAPSGVDLAFLDSMTFATRTACLDGCDDCDEVRQGLVGVCRKGARGKAPGAQGARSTDGFIRRAHLGVDPTSVSLT